jgi:hypothetical protein
MKTHRNRLLAMAVIGLVAIGAYASPAAAQSSRSAGRFTLAHEVRWQGWVLPAGDYTFSLQSAALPALVTVRGPDGSTSILATATDATPKSRDSALTIERRGGARFVSEMYLADVGLHIFYRVPKIPKSEQLLVQGPATTEQVLIAMAKK